MTVRLKHLSEYLALRLTAALVNRLPYRVALFIGWLNAWTAFYLFRIRVHEAKSRIRAVFENRFSDREVNRIAWQSWRNIVFNSIELIRFKNMTLDWVLSVSDCELVMETLKRHIQTGRGGIIACPHMGSWDLAGVTAHLSGIPIFNIVARQRNPWANDYLNALRTSPGMDSITRGSGAVLDIIQKLKAGGMLAILPDVRMRTGGMQVSFLGGEANIGEGMATFARHVDIPIFPCVAFRHGWSHHKIEIFDPVWPDNNLDKDEDIRRMTVAVMDIFDAAIRRNPGQWFWFNKRWILEPS